MKRLNGAFVCMVFAPLIFSGCATPPARNATWFLNVPQGKVRFVFLPKNLGMVANGIPYAETEVEASYQAASLSEIDRIWINQTYSSTAYGKKDAAHAEIKIRTKLPPFRTIKEMVVDVYEPVPNEYREKTSAGGGPNNRTGYGDVDRNTFSKYFSEKISAKYMEINEEALRAGADLVLVKEYESYTVATESGPWYRIYVDASIGNEGK